MAYNKIPLALAYDDNTGNASGLVEFTLGLSDAGDVCDTAPEQGQALVFSGTEWCPSTLPAPGEFTGNLSDVGQVCNAAPTNGQVLTWSGSTDGEWCPSTVATGGGGGVASVNGSAGVVVLTTANINEVTNLYYTEARVTGNGSVSANTAKITNVTTDLVEGTATNTTVDVNSSDGNNATLLAASTSRAGLMTKAKFDEVVANNAKVTNATHTGDVTGASALTIADGVVNTDQIADDAVTVDKLENSINTDIATGVTANTTANAALPKVGGVYENSLVITTGASAVSSLSGASGTIPYFEGTTPAPALQPITTILQNAAVRVEDKDLGDLANVSESGAAEGTPLVYSESAGGWAPQGNKGIISFGDKSVSAVSGSFTVSNVVTVPPGTTGKGDTTVDSFIMFSGTDASSTEYVGTRWGANWVEGPQNIATTQGNYFAYVSADDGSGEAQAGSGVAAVAMNAQALAFMSTGDHGGLNGLADNDHPQYQTSAAALASIAGLTVAAGSIIYATAANTYAVLPPGTSGQVLSMNGTTALRWITLPE
jgi:hypothetical protein